MKKFLPLLILLFSVALLPAQNQPLPPITDLLGILQKESRTLTPAPAREIIRCTRQTEFTANGMIWDSTNQIITIVDDQDGNLIHTESIAQYDETEGFKLIVETVVFGAPDPDNPFAEGMDSIIQYTTDPVSGDLVVYVKLYPYYTPSGQFSHIDIYLNTGIFGFPLGIIFFGTNLFYYDANDLLIATATKQVNIFTAELENGDTTAFSYNMNNQLEQETSWEWNPDSSAYVPLSRYSYTYVSPTEGDVASWVIEEWDGTMWSFVSRTNYTYNKPGQVSMDEIQIGAPGSWITVGQVAYTYDGSDRLTQRLESSVDGGGIITPLNRTTYSYDTPENWHVEIIDQIYINATWENSTRIIIEDCDNAGAAPDAPTSLAAVPAGATSIQLNWNDNSSNESGFEIDRSLNGIDFTLAHEVGANVTSWIDNGLNADTEYYYRVRAVNTTGPSAYSNIASAETWTTSVEDPADLNYLNAWFDGSGQLYLDATGAIRSLQVLDLQGRAVLNALPVGETRNWDASSLYPGLYLIRVQFEDGRQAARKAFKG